MKTLIVDDEFTSQMILQKLLLQYGETAIASSGAEAVAAFSEALNFSSPFDLICLDIMMPDLDGHEVLAQVRQIEGMNGIFGKNAAKVIMVTSLKDKKSIMQAFKSQCEAYLVKPVDTEKLRENLLRLELLDA